MAELTLRRPAERVALWRIRVLGDGWRGGGVDGAGASQVGRDRERLVARDPLGWLMLVHHGAARDGLPPLPQCPQLLPDAMRGGP